MQYTQQSCTYSHQVYEKQPAISTRRLLVPQGTNNHSVRSMGRNTDTRIRHESHPQVNGSLVQRTPEGSRPYVCAVLTGTKYVENAEHPAIVKQNTGPTVPCLGSSIGPTAVSFKFPNIMSLRDMAHGRQHIGCPISLPNDPDKVMICFSVQSLRAKCMVSDRFRLARGEYAGARGAVGKKCNSRFTLFLDLLVCEVVCISASSVRRHFICEAMFIQRHCCCVGWRISIEYGYTSCLAAECTASGQPNAQKLIFDIYACDIQMWISVCCSIKKVEPLIDGKCERLNGMLPLPSKNWLTFQTSILVV